MRVAPHHGHLTSARACSPQPSPEGTDGSHRAHTHPEPSLMGNSQVRLVTRALPRVVRIIWPLGIPTPVLVPFTVNVIRESVTFGRLHVKHSTRHSALTCHWYISEAQQPNPFQVSRTMARRQRDSTPDASGQHDTAHDTSVRRAPPDDHPPCLQRRACDARRPRLTCAATCSCLAAASAGCAP